MSATNQPQPQQRPQKPTIPTPYKPLREELCLKALIVGNTVGKTVFFTRYSSSHYLAPTGYIPSCVDGWNGIHPHQPTGLDFTIGLWDTCYRHSLTDTHQPPLRTLSYPQTGICFLAFALDDRSSFEDVRTMWWPEICMHNINVDAAYILIGLKSELVDKREVEFEEAQALTQELGCDYLEVSSAQGVNIMEAFDTVLTMYYEKLCAKHNIPTSTSPGKNKKQSGQQCEIL